MQIWTALITILVLKGEGNGQVWHLSNLVAFIRINIFVKINLQDWLDNPFDATSNTTVIKHRGILL